MSPGRSGWARLGPKIVGTAGPGRQAGLRPKPKTLVSIESQVVFVSALPAPAAKAFFLRSRAQPRGRFFGFAGPDRPHFFLRSRGPNHAGIFWRCRAQPHKHFSSIASPAGKRAWAVGRCSLCRTEKVHMRPGPARARLRRDSAYAVGPGRNPPAAKAPKVPKRLGPPKAPKIPVRLGSPKVPMRLGPPNARNIPVRLGSPKAHQGPKSSDAVGPTCGPKSSDAVGPTQGPKAQPQGPKSSDAVGPTQGPKNE